MIREPLKDTYGAGGVDEMIHRPDAQGRWGGWAMRRTSPMRHYFWRPTTRSEVERRRKPLYAQAALVWSPTGGSFPNA